MQPDESRKSESGGLGGGDARGGNKQDQCLAPNTKTPMRSAMCTGSWPPTGELVSDAV